MIPRIRTIKSTSGELSFNSIFLFTLVFIVLAIALPVLNYYFNTKFSKNCTNDISEPYTKILLELRDDAKLSGALEVSENHVKFLTSNGALIGTYHLKNGCLSKNSPTYSKEKHLISNLKSADFWINPDLPNLVYVRLIPNAVENIPFFTSFALRGYQHE